MLSLPRALSVDDDELGIYVSPEVRAATAPDAELAGVELAPGTGHRLHGADGDCLQVEAEIEVRDAASVGLTLCRSPDGEEQTIVAWHRDERVLRLDRTRSSLNPEAGRGVHDAWPGAGRAAHADGLPAPLRGRSVRQPARALVGRIYPTRADSSGVALFATDSAHVRRCRVWRRASLW